MCFGNIPKVNLKNMFGGSVGGNKLFLLPVQEKDTILWLNCLYIYANNFFIFLNCQKKIYSVGKQQTKIF